MSLRSLLRRKVAGFAAPAAAGSRGSAQLNESSARALRCAVAASLEALEERRLFATFTPVADTFVREGAFAGTNFGASTALFTKAAAGDTREAYLRFDIGPSNVGMAVLRMDARLEGASAPDTRVGIFAVSDTGWVEGNGTTSNSGGDGADADNSPAGEMTFSNRPPAAGPAIDIVTISGNADQGYAWDVTNHVRAEKAAGRNVVAFVLRNLDSGNDYVTYVSKEGGEFGPTLDVTEDAGPIAALTAANVALPGGATHEITVTYSDPDSVEVLTLSPDDILVFGPNGAAVSVSGVSANSAVNTTPLVVNYTLSGPGGLWDADDTGTYTVRLAAGQVSDAFENVAPPGELGTFDVGEVQPQNPPPTATLAAENVSTSGVTHSFTVTYQDNGSIRRGNINATNIDVIGPEGLPLTVTGVTTEPAGDAATIVATYTVAAPGGFWNADDNGAYTVTMVPATVNDDEGAFVPAGPLGTFQVAFAGAGERELIGTFGVGTPLPKGLNVTDADGTLVTVKVKGGTGQIFRRGNLFDVELNGTTPASALTIKTRGGDGRAAIGDVVATGGLRKLTGKTSDLFGGITPNGPLAKLTLGNVQDGTINVGGGGQMSIALADVTNLSVNSASPIKNIKINSWTDTGPADVIIAPAVGTVKSKGGFGADINAGSVRTIKAGGALTGANIRSAGSVGKVTAAGMNSSSILVAVNDQVSGLPAGSADFTDPSASLKNVTIRGTFADSRIAAPSVGKAALGAVQVVNNGATLGVAANSLRSLTATAGSLGSVRLSKLEDASQSQTDQNFEIRVL